VPCTSSLRCSVIVCTRNRPLSLERCLRALRKQTYVAFEVLVVDSAPLDDQTREVTSRWDARYLLEPLGGLSRARNVGARSCDTKVVAFLDDDCRPEPEWLSALMREFEDPSVMAATGSIRNVPLGAGGDFRPASDADDTRPIVRWVVNRDTPEWFELANFGALGDGGNMAFRRSWFEVSVGFDERLGRGAILDSGEEHRAFFEVLKRGYALVYTPWAAVSHPIPASREELRLRQLRHFSSTAAYATMLWFEEPQYRWRLLQYVVRGFSRKAHTRWHTLLAVIAGPFLYGRLRFQRNLANLPERSVPTPELEARQENQELRLGKAEPI